MLTICTWLWGDKYDLDYVRRLAGGIERNLKQPHRIVLVCDREILPSRAGVDEVWPIIDRHLLNLRGCFARLRMFDPKWQAEHKLPPGHRMVCVDLDAVITGPLDALFDRPESFVILQGANSANPCPFNGSLQMLCTGKHPGVWYEFSLAAVDSIPRYAFPDDQGWLWQKIPDAAAWHAGPESGVFAFQKPGWPRGVDLPDGARLVAFPGWRDPNAFYQLSWIREHWRA